MANNEYFKSRLFDIGSQDEFNQRALELFRFQAENCLPYRDYLQFLNKEPQNIREVEQIPFMPVSFFKSHKVVSGSFTPQATFTSSGTTGGSTSRHYVKDVAWYHKVALKGFGNFFGEISDFCILGLLPSYLEREGSSLIEMVRMFMDLSTDKDSGFFLKEYDRLKRILLKKTEDGKKVLLIGVTFALLDFAEKFELPSNQIMIMETGGMKGRRKEMIRDEVHGILKGPLGVTRIYSEYGMTELLSQAYSERDGLFKTPPWMNVLIRQTDDPFQPEKPGKTGGINIIDLANIDSCAFIETQDLGRMHPDESFEVLGRFDNAEIRGCNLMVI